jgi:hypothetical protein
MFTHLIWNTLQASATIDMTIEQLGEMTLKSSSMQAVAIIQLRSTFPKNEFFGLQVLKSIRSAKNKKIKIPDQSWPWQVASSFLMTQMFTIILALVKGEKHRSISRSRCERNALTLELRHRTEKSQATSSQKLITPRIISQNKRMNYISYNTTCQI